MPAPRVLVVSAEPVGDRMAGPAIRAYELARALAADAQVTLAAPAPARYVDDAAARCSEAGLADYDALIGAVAAHDVVVAQLLPPRLLARIWREPARLASTSTTRPSSRRSRRRASKPPASRARLNRIVGRAAAAHLAAADLVVCASERQRDLWLGVLGARGARRADALEPARGRAVRGARSRRARAARPCCAAGSCPRTPACCCGAAGSGTGSTRRRRSARPPGCRTTSCSSSRASSARRWPSATSTPRARGDRLRALAGPRGPRVHFNPDWVPYEERGAWLLEADLGVCAHPAHLETRFAYRTRIADYLWAGLPVVTSAGDVARRPRRIGRPRPRDRAGGRRRLRRRLRRPPRRSGARARARSAGGRGPPLGPRRQPLSISAYPVQSGHRIGTERDRSATPPSANMHRSPSRPSPPTAPRSSPASSPLTRAAR